MFPFGCVLRRSVTFVGANCVNLETGLVTAIDCQKKLAIRIHKIGQRLPPKRAYLFVSKQGSYYYRHPILRLSNKKQGYAKFTKAAQEILTNQREHLTPVHKLPECIFDEDSNTSTDLERF